GQSFTISTDYTYNPDGKPTAMTAWIDLNDGTGPHEATVTPNATGGTISLTMDHAPAPGTYTVNVEIDDCAEGDQPSATTWADEIDVHANTSCTLYVWGVKIGDGSDNDL